MNDLSWLLYLAGVCDNAGGTFGFLAFVTAISAVLGCIAYMTAAVDLYDEKQEAVQKIAGRAVWGGVVGFLLSVILLVVTPTKETVYAIAASEMGEEVLKSPTAGKALKALDAWLDKQIVENKESGPQARLHRGHSGSSGGPVPITGT